MCIRDVCVLCNTAYVRGTVWVVAGKCMGGKLILNGPNCYPPPTPFCENHNHCITQQDMHERRGDALNHIFWEKTICPIPEKVHWICKLTWCSERGGGNFQNVTKDLVRQGVIL